MVNYCPIGFSPASTSWLSDVPSSSNSRGVPPGAVQPPELDAVAIDFPACIAAEFPAEFSHAWNAVEATLDTIQGLDLAPLARRSPALAGYDWTSYLRCSVARMVRSLAALRRNVPAGARVFDCGAYLGNFARMVRAAGYVVDAADAFGDHRDTFAPITEALRRSGIGVIDTTAGTLPLTRAHYDAVLMMGVIEHVPHTPRFFLESIDELLRPGGLLVLDTPNLGYLYTRQRLARGESIFCPIAAQYYTEIPFEGHHREYTIDEVRWILGALGHEDVRIDTFNYSFYGLPHLAGTDLENHRKMLGDPALREVIFATSRRPASRT